MSTTYNRKIGLMIKLTGLIFISLCLPLAAQVSGDVGGFQTQQPVQKKAVNVETDLTVQIAAFSSKSAAQVFVVENQLPVAEVGIAEVEINDKHLFLLAHGVYNDTASARAAATQLCEKYKISGCWARRLAEIQKYAIKN